MTRDGRTRGRSTASFRTGENARSRKGFGRVCGRRRRSGYAGRVAGRYRHTGGARRFHFHVRGVLEVPGHGDDEKDQTHDLGRARETAGLGCVCLTFDLRGHERTARHWETISRPQNLDDLLAAYDCLAAQANVDPGSIAVVGISYGGYLAVAHRVAARAVAGAALAGDLQGRRLGIAQAPVACRRRAVWLPPARHRLRENRALRACAAFNGDALVVEAEHDEVVPHAVTENYVAAFRSARSLTRRRVAGADHGFAQKSSQAAYTNILVGWLTEMVWAHASSLPGRVWPSTDAHATDELARPCP